MKTWSLMTVDRHDKEYMQSTMLYLGHCPTTCLQKLEESRGT
jgi:hypothetical protein